jgi:hypothetical protein
MNAPQTTSNGCNVLGGEQLPAESGGADALCKAISAAVADKAPGLGYSIEVHVLPRSRLSASVKLQDGRKLADQKFASMDRPLSSSSFERFAAAIATEVAKASHS